MAYIKKISLPGGSEPYIIRDDEALHDATAFDPAGAASTVKSEVIGASGDASSASTIYGAKKYADELVAGLGQFMVFKGSLASEAAIKAVAPAEPGWVYLNTADGSEWVCTKKITAADATAWEKLGVEIDISSKLDVSVFEAHKHSVTVSGTASASNVSGSASIAANSFVDSVTKKGIKATVGEVGITPSAEKFVTGIDSASTSKESFIKASGLNVVTGGASSVAASPVTIKQHTFTDKTASKATAKASATSIPVVSVGTAVEVAKAGSIVNVPNVTNTGSASTWAFAVDANGVLNVTGANGAAPTLGDAIGITPAVSNGSVAPAVAETPISIQEYTFADVTASLAAVAQNLTASEVTVTPVNVVTGVATDGSAQAITAVGLATKDALTAVSASAPSVTLAEGTSSDFQVVTDAAKNSAAVSATVSGTAAGQAFSATADTETPDNV